MSAFWLTFHPADDGMLLFPDPASSYLGSFRSSDRRIHLCSRVFSFAKIRKWISQPGWFLHSMCFCLLHTVEKFLIVLVCQWYVSWPCNTTKEIIFIVFGLGFREESTFLHSAILNHNSVPLVSELLLVQDHDVHLQLWNPKVVFLFKLVINLIGLNLPGSKAREDICSLDLSYVAY